MAITMQEIFEKSMALLDAYDETGAIETDLDALKAKSIKLADMGRKELYALSRTEKTFSFNNKPIPNLLGNVSNFNQVDFIGVDQIYPEQNGVVGAKAYYFESTGAGTAYIEEYNGSAWVTLVTVSMPIGSVYLVYKGTITPSDASYPIRLRFTGTTFYRHCNRALFSYPFTASQIPSYRPWVKVELPSDFMDLSQLVAEYPERQYSKDIDYKWEEPNGLYINYYFDGNYRLIYKPIPQDITSINDTIDCNAVIGQALVYYVTARLAPYENQTIVNFCEQKFNELKFDARSKKPVSWDTVTPTYRIGGGYYGGI